MSLVHPPSRYLTIAEVAAVLRVSKMTVYRLVQAQALVSARFGKSYRIPENAVEDFIRKSEAPPGS